jgi:hypothetical protein
MGEAGEAYWKVITGEAAMNERLRAAGRFVVHAAMKRVLCIFSFVVLAGCKSGPTVALPGSSMKVTAAAKGKGASCDSAGFLEAAAKAERLRVKRRISAETFARMAKEPGTIVLDARGQGDYQQLRVKGSVNLPYTAMAAESLRQLIPNPDTRILIYCRNNLVDYAPPGGFPVEPVKTGKRKLPYPREFDPPQIPKTYGAGLNIPTYITLYIYGYRNVWELDPAVDPNHSAIEFVSRPEARTGGG